MGETALIFPVEVLDAETGAQRGRSNLELARAGFLARFGVVHTRNGYACSLRQWFEFCIEHGVDPFAARAAHIEVWARKLEEVDQLAQSTVAAKYNALSGFYKYAVAEDYTTKNPMLNVRRPQIERISTREGLTRPEFADLLAAAEDAGHRDHALIRLLGINGLRVSEAVGIDIEHVGQLEGQAYAKITRKYGKLRKIPLNPRTAWAITKTIRNRTTGPVFLSREGTRMDRAGAGRVVKRLCKDAEITKHITPHSLRHTFVTMARSANIPDAEIIATTDHADVRMVDYYDRQDKERLARNATATVDAFVDRAR